MSKVYHIPVLLNEVLEGLSVTKGKKYIDATLGGGGHTRGMLSKGGIVLSIDQDLDAHAEAQKWGKEFLDSKQLTLAHSDFAHIKEVAMEKGFTDVSGILFDLGVSTHQLETPERGFSFNRGGPLDMRMNSELSVTAADLVNGLHTKELEMVFEKYGEENFARPIAKAIVAAREKEKITTSNQLAEIVLSVRRRTVADRTHPATRVFQALRIAVNDELHALEKALPAAVEILAVGGRVAVISFHSLEDRIVKQFFKEEENKGVITNITDKPITPTEEEVFENVRSRSGKLRIAQKL